jgi:hypothetical protein
MCSLTAAKLQSLPYNLLTTLIHRVPLQVATAGKNHLKEEITPLLPTGERYYQKISNLVHAALLR